MQLSSTPGQVGPSDWSVCGTQKHYDVGPGVLPKGRHRSRVYSHNNAAGLPCFRLAQGCHKVPQIWGEDAAVRKNEISSVSSFLIQTAVQRKPQPVTTAALLSPFLVARLQLLGGHPQEDVVLFLGVVVLVALKRGKNDKTFSGCQTHFQINTCTPPPTFDQS